MSWLGLKIPEKGWYAVKQLTNQSTYQKVSCSSDILFSYFSFYLCLMVSASTTCNFPSLQSFWCFSDFVVLLLPLFLFSTLNQLHTYISNYFHVNMVICNYVFCPVSWGCRIHWLHLFWEVRSPLTSVLDMTLNNLMVRFQQCWSFGECGVSLHCHRSQVHSGPAW